MCEIAACGYGESALSEHDASASAVQLGGSVPTQCNVATDSNGLPFPSAHSLASEVGFLRESTISAVAATFFVAEAGAL